MDAVRGLREETYGTLMGSVEIPLAYKYIFELSHE